MTNDTPDIAILKNFAKSINRKIFIEESQYQHSAIHPVRYHRRKVYLNFEDDIPIYFACFGDSRDFSKYANYSGVFLDTDFPLNSTFKIRKKDVLDKINPFLRNNSFQTGNRNFDSNIVIEGKNSLSTISLLESRDIQSIIKEVFDFDQLVYFGLNDVKPDFVPTFANKSTIGFYKVNDWIIKTEKIIYIFEQLKSIQKILNT